MDLSPSTLFAEYWSHAFISINLLTVFNVIGSLFLGLMIGYERSYHGRAAGMRTFGLVCMASAALVSVLGYPAYWYGFHQVLGNGGDPTRVVQGIITGIGFLGAGVIMKDGLSISGLTTAASIWASSVVGILIGLDFYAAGILLALICSSSMVLVSRLEKWLPSHPAVGVVLRFKKDYRPEMAVLRHAAQHRGFDIVDSTLAINYHEAQPEWHFVATVRNQGHAESLAQLAEELSHFDGVDSFSLEHARN